MAVAHVVELPAQAFDVSLDRLDIRASVREPSSEEALLGADAGEIRLRRTSAQGQRRQKRRGRLPHP